jgi:putative spermidine/putrescine transport system permease protein
MLDPPRHAPRGVSGHARRRVTVNPVRRAGYAWIALLIPPLLLFTILLVGSQAFFVASSFHRDLGMGRTAPAWDLRNYAHVLTDRLFLRSLWTTVRVSAVATLATLSLAYAVAYVIARLRSRWGTLMLAAIVASNFITIVVKAFGLMILFSGNGLLNRVLLDLGLIAQPINLLGTETGVVVGLMQFTLGFAVLLLYSVVQTIPRNLEDAAKAHGASRRRVLLRVLLPLSLPGLAVGGLMIFNMCMGAFTSAALLGSGRILTLPVLIEQTVLLQVNYAMASTLAVVLLVVVVLINILSLLILRCFRAGRLAII